MKFQCEYTCKRPGGLTLLGAVSIVKIVLHSYSAVSIEANMRCANATDINGLLSLSIEDGDVVNVTTDGQDGYDVMKSIETVLGDCTESVTRCVDQPWVPQLVSA